MRGKKKPTPQAGQPAPPVNPHLTDDSLYDDDDTYAYAGDDPYGYNSWGYYYYTDTYTLEEDPDSISHTFIGAFTDDGKWSEIGRTSMPPQYDEEGDIMTNKTVQYTPLQQYPHFEGDLFQVLIGIHLLVGTILFILVICCAINQTWQRSNLMVTIRHADRVILENGCCGSYGCGTRFFSTCKDKNNQPRFKTCAEHGLSVETFLQYVCICAKEVMRSDLRSDERVVTPD